MLLSENIFSSYSRLSDDELYNYSQEGQEKRYCIDCGCEITIHGIRCSECASKAMRYVERPSREKLKEMIRTMPFTQIGIFYGVTDNAIRKWCKSFNLPYKSNHIKQINEEEWKNI